VILANTVYFISKWQNRFSPKDPNDFHLLNGSTIQTKMISTGLSNDMFRIEKDYIAVDLPYFDQPISMIIFMPSDHGKKNLVRLEKKLPDLINKLPLSGSKSNTRAVLSMPEFTMSSTININEQMKQLGIKQLFSEKADLSGISDEKPLWIDKILHSAFILVDERGTEAAAATTSGMLGATLIDELIYLNIDHPFLFVIYDKPTKSVLFMGRVMDPSL